VRTIGVVLLLGGLIGGCSADATSAIDTAPASLSPHRTGLCSGFGAIDPANPPPSLLLTRDPVLEAEFPSEIDGQPVSDVASGRLVETLCLLGGEASVTAAQRAAASTVDITRITDASGSVPVDGRQVTILAFRLPSHRGDELLGAIGILSSAVVPGTQKFANGLEQTTAGGKSVWRWVNAADGSVSFLYATSDTLFDVENVSQSQADKVFAALP
jgi:hypothetical protein